MGRSKFFVWIIASTTVLALWSPSLSWAQKTEPGGRYDCVIQPRSIVDLGTPEDGILTRVLVKRGQHVEKGEPVAELDSELQRLQMALMRLRSGDAATVDSTQAKLAFRKAQSERMKRLYKRRVISTKQRDEAAVETALAEFDLKSAKMGRAINKVELKQAQERLNRRTLRSPVKGIVTEVTMSTGEFVHEQVSVMRIAELHPLHVEVFLPVSEFRTVRKGATATVYP